MLQLGLWYRKASFNYLISFFDADFASSRIDRKSTNGACQFLNHSLVSWNKQKQNSVAFLTTEDEYIVIGSCCA